MNEHDQTSQTNPTLELFTRFGFSQLTEIQKRAVPKILQKRDSLIVAPTGSGKTECSVIPIFEMLSRVSELGKIKALYITPLRALNRDVFRRITKYAQGNSLAIDIRHGDTSQRDRKRISDNPPDVLITTPETLVILLTQPKMLAALAALEWVIIDEVHELLSSERGSQLSLTIERLEINSKYPLTRVGLSATVGNFEEAAKFVVGTKRRCEIIRDTSVRKYDVDIRYVDGTISDVAQKILDYVSEMNLDSPVLLFTNTRGEAEFLASVLRERAEIPIEMHHGSLSKEVREETESSLRLGNKGIVVCTSSLELGLDLGSIELVIHYGSPRQVSKFVQRIGRSRHNRHSSARGLIVTNSADDEFEANAILARIRLGSIEDQKIHHKSLDVLAHHLVGLVMQMGEMTVGTTLDILTRAYPFRDLTYKELVDVLSLLDSNNLIYFDQGTMTFKKRGYSFKYHFENLSTIPDILRFKVFDSVGKKIIGSLDQRFVGDYGDSGNIFVLRGMKWRILSVDEKSFTVNVEPFRGGGITVPYWEGESIPIDYNTARKVGQFRTGHDPKFKIHNDIISNLDITVPDQTCMVVESNRSEGSIVIHACFGTKINTTLAALLSSMLSSILGSTVVSRSDAYRIVLSSNSRISRQLFLNVIVDEYDLYAIIQASLVGTHNVNWRTWCVAKKFGIVGRGAIYDKRSARFLYERYVKTPLVDEALRELFHDKYDVPSCTKILDDIRHSLIKIEWIEVDKFTRLAEPILDHTAKYYSSPTNLDQGILNLVKERLYSTKHRLICARCGRWESILETRQVVGTLACPYCKGRQITATFYSDHDLSKIIRKRYDGSKVSADESHRLARAWKVASLVESFGKTAIIVMSGYGIGADTAARILRNMVDEEYLFRQIYEAERKYVMNRGFWDS